MDAKALHDNDWIHTGELRVDREHACKIIKIYKSYFLFNTLVFTFSLACFIFMIAVVEGGVGKI